MAGAGASGGPPTSRTHRTLPSMTRTLRGISTLDIYSGYLHWIRVLNQNIYAEYLHKISTQDIYWKYLLPIYLGCLLTFSASAYLTQSIYSRYLLKVSIQAGQNNIEQNCFTFFWAFCVWWRDICNKIYVFIATNYRSYCF